MSAALPMASFLYANIVFKGNMLNITIHPLFKKFAGKNFMEMESCFITHRQKLI